MGVKTASDRLRIFGAGIATETNTFAPIPTALEDFHVQRGSDARAGRVENATLDLSQTWGRQAHAGGHEFIFGLMAFAQPAGTTLRAAYETLRDELLEELEAALPVDVVLLNLHGAMVAQGYDDCEQDLTRRVRELAGPETIIGVELDLHCHLTPQKLAPADLVITYKEYPHVDTIERGRELFDLAVRARRKEIHPKMALFECRTIGLYPTTRQPLRRLVDAMSAAEQRPGVLSVSLGHGFQFADLPSVGAKVLVVADGDLALAERVAEEIGRQVYAVRCEIGVESFALPLDAALSRALASTKVPVVVADPSDNTGGGAPGDATFALRWLLDHAASSVALALFYDPEVVSIAKKVGPGEKVTVRLGGKLGPSSGMPVDLEATVLAVRENYLHAFPQQSGDPWLFAAGDVVSLRSDGIDIVVSSKRCQVFAPEIFSDFGIDPRSKRLLIVKSVQHFYGAFAPLAGEVIYMAAPGAVAPDPRLIAYRRLDTHRLYPWAEDPLGR